MEPAPWSLIIRLHDLATALNSRLRDFQGALHGLSQLFQTEGLRQQRTIAHALLAPWDLLDEAADVDHLQIRPQLFCTMREGEAVDLAGHDDVRNEEIDRCVAFQDRQPF